MDPEIPCVLCGDFNTVVDPHIDCRGCNPSSRWAYNWPSMICDFTSSYDLSDIWRLHHLDTHPFTRHRPNSSQASRLDMFLASSFFLPFILSVDILPFFRSNHSYMYLKLSLPDAIHHGKGIWKFNTDHLKDLAGYAVLGILAT